jgi:hypothetical protein
MKIPYFAVAFVLLGIFLAVAPWTVAPVCEVNGLYAQLANGKSIPMPCGWTARAEIGLGALLVLAGVLLALVKEKESGMVLGITGAGIGVLAILYPTVITKMCALADHPCRTMTEPTLVITGIVIIIVSLALFFASYRKTPA